MKELSVFVDESGDLGEYEKHAPYYIITMIFHDQSVDISTEIEKLNEALRNMGYGNKQAIHTEPLIRREDPYRYFQPNERRAIFSKLFYFTLGCDIKYKSFVYRKSEYENIFKLEARMASYEWVMLSPKVSELSRGRDYLVSAFSKYSNNCFSISGPHQSR